MKNSRNRIIAIVLLLALGAWLIISILPSGSSTEPAGKIQTERVEPPFTKEAELAILDSTGSDTIIHLDIELAESAAEIQYGMMYRKKMDRNTGMLFLMGRERPQSFYMKNTYVSLDIIYINDAKEIVSIQRNAEPLKETSLPSEGEASMVLEVIGGLSDELGINKGAKISWQRK